MPIPTTKENVTIATMIGLLPDVRQKFQMFFMRQLGRQQPHMVPLGQHTEYFSGPEPRDVLRQFQTDLENIEREIMTQNEQLELTYEYLKQSCIQNSAVI